MILARREEGRIAVAGTSLMAFGETDGVLAAYA
jgi:hypothetical protein